MKKFIVSSNDAGRAILKYVEKMLHDVPKSKIEKLFRNKDIKLNASPTRDKQILLRAGDVVIIYNIKSQFQPVISQLVHQTFTVIYEDDNILVVSKPAGVIVSGGAGSLDEQILNYLKFHQVDSFVPASIGRLDKVTSGLIVYAKNYHALRHLQARHPHFVKNYLFKSDLPRSIATTFKIAHDEEHQREVCGIHGKSTSTIFTVGADRKVAQILTGRKHQIRASLSKLGYPIYGDRKYGGKPAERVFLHAHAIKFRGLGHPLAYLNEVEIMVKPKW